MLLTYLQLSHLWLNSDRWRQFHFNNIVLLSQSDLEIAWIDCSVCLFHKLLAISHQNLSMFWCKCSMSLLLQWLICHIWLDYHYTYIDIMKEFLQIFTIIIVDVFEQFCVWMFCRPSICSRTTLKLTEPKPSNLHHLNFLLVLSLDHLNFESSWPNLHHL